MRCQKCAADSEVFETRSSGPWTRRTRLCFNGHKFITYEVYRGNVDTRTRAGTIRHLKSAALTHQRKTRVMSSVEKSASLLARELGITEARVRQIRKELVGVTPSKIKAWCEGRSDGGYAYPPKANCWSEKKYES